MTISVIRKQGFASSTLVFIIIAVVLMLALVLFFWKSTNTVKTPADVIACQSGGLLQSGLQGEGVYDKIVGTNTIDYYCPAHIVDVEYADVDEVGRSYKDEYEKYDYASPEEFNLDKIMYDEAVRCYQKVNYGRSKLFERGGIFDSEEYTFCLVCSVVTFDDEIAGLGLTDLNPSRFVFEEEIGLSEKTLFELTGDHLDIALGTLDLTYSTQQRQAVMYVRTNLPRSVDAAVLIFNALIPKWAEKIGLEEIDASYITDSEEIRIIDYVNPADVAQECTHLVSVIE